MKTANFKNLNPCIFCMALLIADAFFACDRCIFCMALIAKKTTHAFFAWLLTFLGFFLMHFIGGVILSCVFQPAHVMETSEYDIPENYLGIHRA